MTGLWNQKGIPHKGWTCVGVDDLGTPEGECEMCGKEEIRYLHHMDHPDYPSTLSVGCMCAEKMEDDYSIANRPSKAKLRERKLKNAASRKKRWLKLKGWKISKKGNPYISKDGFHITIFKHGNAYKYVISNETKNIKDFSPRQYATQEEAKLGAFDTLISLSSK